MDTYWALIFGISLIGMHQPQPLSFTSRQS
ncbi:hypothetical protein E2C01_057370 [Portunus trituberculatus]|uniref:Uncharacterized protein n=1 Tax=Portunus trituberculatus TaxID=210409 RepID=A0A5B7H363_PORTR|nr:hypothetical protein [Portunus trituberculatus]